LRCRWFWLRLWWFCFCFKWFYFEIWWFLKCCKSKWKKKRGLCLCCRWFWLSSWFFCFMLQLIFDSTKDYFYVTTENKWKTENFVCVTGDFEWTYD
jgi:hypothetical protein